MTVEVQYSNRAQYSIPTAYIVRWGIHTAGAKAPGEAARVLRVRRARKNQVVRATFTDGTKGDIAWDTVLMACEPRYEHYGGLTEESTKLTESWARRGRRFRIDDA